MADEVIQRTVVEIEADVSGYLQSIDEAVARTKALILQRERLRKELDQNDKVLQKNQDSLERNTQAIERKAKAVAKAAARYGEESAQAKKLRNQEEQLRQKGESLANSKEKLSQKAKKLKDDLHTLEKALGKNIGGMGESSQAADQLTRAMDKLSRMVAVAAMGYAGKKFLEATIGSLMEFEQYEASFSVLLGSAQKAKEMMADLQQFAANTPFQLPQVVDAGQLLLNYGVAGEDLIATMTRLGDLSLGQADKLERISLAYGQMLAKGKVTGEELRQITEAGVSLNDALAQAMGVTTQEIGGLVSQGMVGIDALNQAIESLTTGTGKFAGMMETQAGTLAGLWSSFQDELGEISRGIGEEAFGTLKGALLDLRGEISAMRDSGELQQLMEGYGAAFGALTKLVVGLATGLAKNRQEVGMLVTALGALAIVKQVAIGVEVYHKAVKDAAKAQALFNGVVAVNPYVLLAAALVAAAGSVLLFAGEADSAAKRVRELNRETEKIGQADYDFGSDQVKELERVLTTTVPRVEELSAKANELGGVSNLAAGEQKLLEQSIQEVNQAIGEEAISIDGQTGLVEINTQAIRDNIAALQARAKAEAVYDKMKSNSTSLVDLEMRRWQQEEQLQQMEADKLAARRDAFENPLDYVFNLEGLEGYDPKLEKLQGQLEDTNREIEALQKNSQALEDYYVNVLGESLDKLDLEDKGKKNGDGYVGGFAGAVSKVEDVLKSTYEEQLSIAKDYLNQRKSQIDEEYNYQVTRIKDSYSARLASLKREYEAQKSQVDAIIGEIDREIAALKKTREQEKQGDALESAQQRVSALEAKIQFARSPEEKAELEKELRRQQESLKDLQLEQQVDQLEGQKALHQEKLTQLQEEYDARKTYLEEQQAAELEAAQKAREQALADIETVFTQFQDSLASTYGYVNTETLSIGRRFADATVGAIDSGFSVVAQNAQSVIDEMVEKVQDAVAQMNARVNRYAQDREESTRRERMSRSIDQSDNRSMQVVNNFSRGLTLSQVDAMMARQAERMLYGRR